MAIKITQIEDKNSKTIILPLVLSSDLSIIKDKIGLQYTPSISLQGKEVHYYNYVNEEKVLIVVGLGNGHEKLKSSQYIRSAISKIKTKNGNTVDILVDHLEQDILQEVVIGCYHSQYVIAKCKTVEMPGINTPNINIVTNGQNSDILLKAQNIALAQQKAMHLIDLPSNIKTPKFITEFVKDQCHHNGNKLTILDQEKLKDSKMDALLAVGQGSNNETFCLIIEYHGSPNTSKAHLGLVGKGITFDTGGVSIKPSTNMAFMKSDMSGAAAVIGAMELITRSKLPINVVATIPLAENVVDANSYKPGDVIGSYSGKSIEVIDTDAEGRLILADGLSYIINKFDPEYTIDLATLTGNCIAALGNHACGLFSNHEDLADNIMSSGQEVLERTWRLPLWEDYASDMNSNIADIKNFSGKPTAGAITAAKFLEYFVEKKPWAHLDIAGVAYAENEFAQGRSASGFGVRLLTTIAEKLSR